MELKLKCGNLTTENAASSYGIPVLVCSDGIARGAGDAMPCPPGDPLAWMFERPVRAMSSVSAGLAERITSCATAVREENRSHPLVVSFLGETNR